MKKIDEISKLSWIQETFPEWGTWLNEEIEQECVASGSVALWWLGCTGIWVKTAENNNICVDLWCGSGKRTQKSQWIDPNHQMARMSGGKKLQPNLRTAPCVLDIFEIKQLDAVLSTHFHNDHMDINVAAAVLKNCDSSVPFIGPKACVERWISWGIPESRCITAKVGDVIPVKNIEIVALDSFDRTALITSPAERLEENPVASMDDRALNYLIKTSGGTIYHSGDSHYSNYYAKHGKEHKIDVALASFGENPVGITDKMTGCDVLRMAEALQTEVIIPVHYDIWSNFQADPNEILMLYQLKKHRLKYRFKPFIWQVGAKFIYPLNKSDIQCQYPRGFEDCFETEINLPYKSFL